ncbi:unnamed protein product [Boreogadus saida]
MNSLMKTAPLVGSTELSTDDRAHQRLAVMAMGVEDTQLLLYPRLIPLHNMELEGEAVPLRCSEDRLSDGGAVLLENGHALFLWLGQACPPELIQGPFNLPSLAHLQPNTVLLESYDEEKDIITRKGNAKASATRRTKAWQRIADRVNALQNICNSAPWGWVAEFGVIPVHRDTELFAYGGCGPVVSASHLTPDPP